ncbi:hypothetical protein TCAL_02205 [Tigriopus californicus]|uniref:Ubiquitin-like protease family profile domain-containing protein n=2 Tax=Tigriopus californicus TaxID=6832 RepID=A0A553P8S5_TIGCA|nr:hypothetical protein TCAL_02205 [Tigriopus californicus]|eukprot:TCALIF_02205-PA protein Name:"Similar to SENP1 Sentrin-specific protease 1 (Homo sapiens)" AED:0.21 eAED:0.21 QI:0/-1/0/1/-1/1/1/0/622
MIKRTSSSGTQTPAVSSSSSTTSKSGSAQSSLATKLSKSTSNPDVLILGESLGTGSKNELNRKPKSRDMEKKKNRPIPEVIDLEPQTDRDAFRSFSFEATGTPHIFSKADRAKKNEPLNILSRLRAKHPAACVARDFSRPPKIKHCTIKRLGIQSPVSRYSSPMSKNKRLVLRQQAEDQCVDLTSKDRYAQFLKSFQKDDSGTSFRRTPGLNLFGTSPFFHRRSETILSRGAVDVNTQSPETSRQMKASFKDKFLTPATQPEVINLVEEEEEENSSNSFQRPVTKGPDDDIREILEKYATSPDLKQAPEPRIPRVNTLEADLKLKPITKDDFLERIQSQYSANARERERRMVQAQTRLEHAQVRTKKLEDALAQRMKKTLEITEVPIEEVQDEEEEEELPEITTEMETVINNACSSRGQALIDRFNIAITRKDVDTLKGLNWLNDEVINFYMQLICERSKTTDNWPNVHAFNTFFYPKIVQSGHAPVKRWTKKVDIFSFDLLLIPVHLGMHWCLAVVDLRKPGVYYYDSMLGENKRCLKAVLQYLEDEHRDKKKSEYDTSNFEAICVKDIPQQMNGSDCGMFACKFAEYLSRNSKITFDQQDMPYFRKRMIYEIVSGILLHP